MPVWRKAGWLLILLSITWGSVRHKWRSYHQYRGHACRGVWTYTLMKSWNVISSATRPSNKNRLLMITLASYIVISLRKLKPKLLDFALILKCKKYQRPNHWRPAWYMEDLLYQNSCWPPRSQNAGSKKQPKRTLFTESYKTWTGFWTGLESLV